MSTNSKSYHRRTLRLPNFDYSTPGAYFVTIVAFKHLRLFASIDSDELNLTRRGIIVDETWNDLVKHISNIDLGEHVIMPNHFHGIVWIKESEAHVDDKSLYLTEIVRQFKSFSARRINQEFGTMGNPVWQRNYYEHVIRNEADLSRIREYIVENPCKWILDKYYSD